VVRSREERERERERAAVEAQAAVGAPPVVRVGWVGVLGQALVPRVAEPDPMERAAAAAVPTPCCSQPTRLAT
jgi:hypothetical protein